MFYPIFYKSRTFSNHAAMFLDFWMYFSSKQSLVSSHPTSHNMKLSCGIHRSEYYVCI